MSRAQITVTATRNIKGARRRVLAMQATDAAGTPGDVGLSYFEPGGVSVHFTTADGSANVFLPPEVVARIKAGPVNFPAQIVPPLTDKVQS